MLVGIDVTHPQPGAQANATSIAGVVTSVDNLLGQWPADVRIQNGRQELVQALQDVIRSRLLFWRQRNGTLPTDVLVYRDGVSGQYNIVTDVELPQIRKACEKVHLLEQSKSHLPRITIIICGKCHHTRFYPTDDGKDADHRTFERD